MGTFIDNVVLNAADLNSFGLVDDIEVGVAADYLQFQNNAGALEINALGTNAVIDIDVTAKGAGTVNMNSNVEMANGIDITAAVANSNGLGSTTKPFQKIYVGAAATYLELIDNAGTCEVLSNGANIYVGSRTIAGPIVGDVYLKGDKTWVEGTNLNPEADCSQDIGENAGNCWDNLWYDVANALQCDLAELQWVQGPYDSGTVVEMAEQTTEQIEFENEMKSLSEEWAKRRPAQHRRKPFHKEFGLKGSWKEAKKRSTKCPSVISFIPGMILGSTADKVKKMDIGKMRPIALSGSVQFVYVEGAFEVGDILVSAGKGNAMVDNDAPSNQRVGYAKESGTNKRTEVWIK